jgi:ethanolamine ammonia-lyase small subunit
VTQPQASAFSSSPMPSRTTEEPWAGLRKFTPARIALGRAGDSLPTAALLEFNLAHARARDAVHAIWDRKVLASELAQLNLPITWVHSAAPDRATYLRNPNRGRALTEEYAAKLRSMAETGAKPDVVFVIADGLSAQAPARHAFPLLQLLMPLLSDWRIGPMVVAEQARVALGDAVGQALGAAMVVMLIGERPGLSAPDSLGAYLTFAPRIGCTDAERNCISNIRPDGLGYANAAQTLARLMHGARRLELTGIGLKDDQTLIGE